MYMYIYIYIYIYIYLYTYIFIYSDQAVAGSLRTIISMLLNTSYDRDIRIASEDVLRAVGFQGGT